MFWLFQFNVNNTRKNTTHTRVCKKRIKLGINKSDHLEIKNIDQQTMKTLHFRSFLSIHINSGHPTCQSTIARSGKGFPSLNNV